MESWTKAEFNRLVNEIIKKYARIGESITREQASEIAENEICFGEVEQDD